MIALGRELMGVAAGVLAFIVGGAYFGFVVHDRKRALRYRACLLRCLGRAMLIERQAGNAALPGTLLQAQQIQEDIRGLLGGEDG